MSSEQWQVDPLEELARYMAGLNGAKEAADEPPQNGSEIQDETQASSVWETLVFDSASEARDRADNPPQQETLNGAGAQGMDIPASGTTVVDDGAGVLEFDDEEAAAIAATVEEILARAPFEGEDPSPAPDLDDPFGSEDEYDLHAAFDNDVADGDLGEISETLDDLEIDEDLHAEFTPEDESDQEDAAVIETEVLAVDEDEVSLPASETWEDVDEWLPELGMIDAPADLPADEPPPAAWTRQSILWDAEYFANTSMAGEPVAVRRDEEIDFNWGGQAPALGVPARVFSVRWRGMLPLEAGQYQFRMTAPDGIRLWLNGRLVISAWYDQSEQSYSREFSWHGGPIDVRVEHYENGGDARATLSWEKVRA